MLRSPGSRVTASCPLILVGFMTLYACGGSSKKSGDTPPVLITTCQSNQILSTDGKTCVNVGNIVTGLTQADCDKIDQILSADGKACEVKPVVLPEPILTQADCDKTNQVLSADSKSCVNKTGVQPDPILTQADCDKTNQVLSADGKSCVNKPVTLPIPPPNIIGLWTYCRPFFEKWVGGRLEFFADGTYTDVLSFDYTNSTCSPNNMVPGSSERLFKYKYKLTGTKVFPADVSGAKFLDGAYEFDTNMIIGSLLGDTKYLALHIDGEGALSISYVSSFFPAEDGKSAATRAKTFFDLSGDRYKKK